MIRLQIIIDYFLKTKKKLSNTDLKKNRDGFNCRLFFVSKQSK